MAAGDPIIFGYNDPAQKSGYTSQQHTSAPILIDPQAAIAGLNATYARPLGAWSSATAYTGQEVVTYNGGTYRAKAASTNVTPGTDVTKWETWGGGGGGSNGTATVLALGNVTSTATVTTAGQYVTATLTGNTAFVFPATTNGTAYTFTLEVAQDGTGGRAITWPGSVLWPGGAAPTLSTSASAVSILQFTSRDGGTTWYGSPQSIPPAVNGTPETINAVTTAGSAQTIPDPTTATINYLTLTATTCTLTFPTAAAGKSFSLILKQDGTGGRLVSWPTVTWIGSSSTAPTLSTGASKQDVFTFMCVDGSTWLGMYGGGS